MADTKTNGSGSKKGITGQSRIDGLRARDRWNAQDAEYDLSMWKMTRVSDVRNAIDQVQAFAGEPSDEVIPLVAVPFMGEIGRKLCFDTKTAWIDLSGNARIFAPGLKIMVDGNPKNPKVASSSLAGCIQ